MENVQTKRTWFSGAYVYHLPVGNDVLGRLERYAALADHLLGVSLNASTIWELAPWSWMADWWGDIGAVMSNSSAVSSNGLVMKYGYLMRQTDEFNRFVIPEGLMFKRKISTGPVSSTFTRVTKERRKATPYGFGVDLKTLSPFQWSILGALGLTRAPGILH